MTAAVGVMRLPRRLGWPGRLIAALAVAAALAAGYLLWLRDSSLVAVKEVRVEGVTANAEDVSAALERAALEMTTLHVRTDELRAAVRPYPTVASVSADPSFPHGLTVSVTERRPVALVTAGDAEVPVAGDGTLLGGVDVSELELPAVDAAASESTLRLEDTGLDQAAVLGAAPEPLLGVVESTTVTEDGVEATLEGGILLRFGSPSRAGAKWDAAARVLAEPSVGSFTYVDLRAPARPAVGGGAPTEVPAPPVTG